MQARHENNMSLSVDTLQLLQNILNSANGYSLTLMHVFETLQQTHAQDIWICLIAEPLKDQRCYNLPTAHKTIIPGDEIVTRQP